ncbi:4-aminobutyrate--2-oxoglutarate transaminase [Mobilicoccus massiliensis]|uniref:4-aminobutyrate--2-oxoglutarate transaminase n=1 Tax=Mobilicoccus massiliensis TaxID=1522310 RepID=UPI0006932A63|nr:4-aminobutyrate--2-oxoglutarate transaminase [Mobilicoccus massiliensis]
MDTAVPTTEPTASDAAIAQPVEQRRILVTEVPGPRSREKHAHRTQHVPVGLGITLPVFVERASGGILVDADGNHLIDLASGIAVTSVGASHPAVVAAVQKQAAAFTHTCFMVTEYDGYAQVAERLNRIAPGEHEKRTALFTTGAEAIENAVKIARAYTGRPDVVVFDHAYHGRTLLTLGMTAKEAPYKTGFAPFPEHIHRAPFAYPLHWRTGAQNAVPEALASFEALIERVGPDRIAAAVIEPIQGEGGFIVPGEGFLAGIREITERHGIVMVADEVQAGMGRTGRMLAIEHEGVVPDLVCTAKALAGGMPLSAVTGRAEIMETVGAGGLGGTYAGNPLSCAAALAVLDELECDDTLLQRARRIEELVRTHLEPLVDETGIVAEVRGRGAMMAIEICHPGTDEPDAPTAKEIAAACHAQGVVTLTCGTHSNVLRLLPPLVISDELLEDALGVLADAVRAAR